MRHRGKGTSVIWEDGIERRNIVRSLAGLAYSWSESAASEEEIVRALLDCVGEEDPAIPRHGERTANYALALGTVLDLKEPILHELRWSALLHDIGAVTLPDSIVKKSGCLSGEEYALFQSHPRAGAELLSPFPFLGTSAVWIALHHERWDGCGYPYGLRGPYIPLGSRILAVADAFDALSAPDRSEKPLSFELAARVLEAGAGSQFDPHLVGLFATSLLRSL